MKRTALTILAVACAAVVPAGAGVPPPDPNDPPPDSIPETAPPPPGVDEPPGSPALRPERVNPQVEEVQRRIAEAKQRVEEARERARLLEEELRKQAAETAPKEPAGGEPATTAGAITEVTLYQGTALVTRHINIPDGQQGPFEVVVPSLPTATDPTTVFADRAEGVEVRSVACRQRPPAEEERLKGEVARLDDALRQLEMSISTSRNEMALRRIRQDYLKALGNFAAPAVSAEMSHGVLQAKEIEQLTQMHFKEYETASQEILELDFQVEEDTRRLARLKSEREKLAAGPPVTYDAVLYLERGAAGPASLKLNYLVQDCGWSPVYNVRGDTAKNQIEIEFNALIHQVSGEDWNGARLALSTASPTVSAYNPKLTPLFVRTSSGAPQQQASFDNTVRYNQALDQRKQALEGQFRGQSFNEAATANFSANEFAANVQLIELSERMSELRRLEEDSVEDDLSIEYQLERPVTLVSRRDAQMVPVLQHRGEARFYHVSVPILTSAVFREAELANATKRDLLGGQVNVYLDGRFTGRTDMPTIARGRTFNLGFGVDGQLRVRRSLLDRTETVQGGNRQVRISVEVVVDNYKEEAVPLILRERTPHMEDAASLRVSVGEMSHPLSDDADYERFEKSKGVLLWNLDVKPGSRKDATSLRYAYSLEFDKNQTLQDITSEQKTRLRSEFIQKSRRASFKK